MTLLMDAEYRLQLDFLDENGRQAQSHNVPDPIQVADGETVTYDITMP